MDPLSPSARLLAALARIQHEDGGESTTASQRSSGGGVSGGGVRSFSPAGRPSSSPSPATPSSLRPRTPSRTALQQYEDDYADDSFGTLSNEAVSTSITSSVDGSFYESASPVTRRERERDRERERERPPTRTPLAAHSPPAAALRSPSPAPTPQLALRPSAHSSPARIAPPASPRHGTTQSASSPPDTPTPSVTTPVSIPAPVSISVPAATVSVASPQTTANTIETPVPPRATPAPLAATTESTKQVLAPPPASTPSVATADVTTASTAVAVPTPAPVAAPVATAIIANGASTTPSVRRTTSSNASPPQVSSAAQPSRPLSSSHPSAPPPHPLASSLASTTVPASAAVPPSSASQTQSTAPISFGPTRKVVSRAHDGAWTEDHLKLLDLVARYTTPHMLMLGGQEAPGQQTPPSNTWLRHMPLLVLVHEGIVTRPTPVFSFAYTPTLVEHVPISWPTNSASCATRNVWLNLAHEACAFLADLHAANLLAVARVSASSVDGAGVVGSSAGGFESSLAYQVTPLGRTLLQDLQTRWSGAASAAAAIERLLHHGPARTRYSVGFDGNNFVMGGSLHSNATGANTPSVRRTHAADPERVSFALTPYFPAGSLWHAKAASRFSTSSACMKGVNLDELDKLSLDPSSRRPWVLRAPMSDVMRVQQVALLIGEWAPLGENTLAELNDRLGANVNRTSTGYGGSAAAAAAGTGAKVRRNPAQPLALIAPDELSALVTGTSTTLDAAASASANASITSSKSRAHVIDSDRFHFCAVEVETEETLRDDRGNHAIAKHCATFAASAHANGVLTFGATVEHVTGQALSPDGVSFDALARVIATFQTRSIAAASALLFTRAQRRMADAMYGGGGAGSEDESVAYLPSRPIVILASSLSPRPPHGAGASFYREHAVLESGLASLLGGPLSKTLWLDGSNEELLILGRRGAMLVGPRAKRHEETMHAWLNLQSRSQALESAWHRVGSIGARIARLQAEADVVEMDSSAQHLLDGLRRTARLELDAPLEQLAQAIEYLRESVDLLGAVGDAPTLAGGDDRATARLKKSLSLDGLARSLRRRTRDLQTRVLPSAQRDLARLHATLASAEARQQRRLRESIEQQSTSLTPLRDASERGVTALGVIQALLGLGVAISILDRMTGEWSLVTETSFESLIGEPIQSFAALDDLTFILFNVLLFGGITALLYRAVDRFRSSARATKKRPYVLKLMRVERRLGSVSALETLLREKRATEAGWTEMLQTTVRHVHWSENADASATSSLSWRTFEHPPSRIDLFFDPRDEFLLHAKLTWNKPPPPPQSQHGGHGHGRKENEVEAARQHLFTRLVELHVLAPENAVANTSLVTRTAATAAPFARQASQPSIVKPMPAAAAPSITPTKVAQSVSNASQTKTPTLTEPVKQTETAATPPKPESASTATATAQPTKQTVSTPAAATVPAAEAAAVPAATPPRLTESDRERGRSPLKSPTSGRALAFAVAAFSPSRMQADGSPVPPPMYNEKGQELVQPIEINPVTGKPRVKRRFARRIAGLILAHIAKENAAAATREVLEYQARKQEMLEQVGNSEHPPPRRGHHRRGHSHHHSRKQSVTDFFTHLLSGDQATAEEEAAAREQERKRDAALRAVLGEDPTQRGSMGGSVGEAGDNSSQIETLHRAGNIFNAVLRADRKQVDALLRANPHVLSQRGPVGELPLHMCFLYGSPAHHVLAFYLMSRCPHVVAEPYLGTEYTGENILHIAIIQQDPRMVELLVRKAPALLSARATGRFFSRGQPCYYGETPLGFACATGQQQIVGFLIDSGADIEASDTNGNNALHLMVIHSRPEMYTFVKRRWVEWNESRPESERASGERVLWKRRNKDGFTPMTLSAKLGQMEMFSFLLEEEKQMQWAYGPITCWVYPLEQIDMPLRLPQDKQKQIKSADDSDSDSDSDDDDDDDGAENPRALELIVNEAHLDLLMHPRMIELVKQKWDRFASRIFFKRFMVVLVYLCLFTATTIHRQTENINGIEEWGAFEDHLRIYKNQTEHIAALTLERTSLLAEVDTHALEVLEHRTSEFHAMTLQAAVVKTRKVEVPSEPDLDQIRSELLSRLALKPLPTQHFIDIDIDHLETLLARENEKAASRESAGVAKRRRVESDMEDGVRDNNLPFDLATMSDGELRELLTPPSMLYDDGLLGGFIDMVFDLAAHPPSEWAEVVWRYPCILFLGELLVIGGAVAKGNNELGELRERGINNYFGAAGSAFFENTLSLVFSSLMFVVFGLSLSGSYLVRMFMGLCSMVGWSYIFFFLLAFRMTGPMIVMIYQMLTTDVIRFLTVWAVFLVAFSQSFFVLFDHDGFGGFVTSVQTCFLAMLGDFVFDDYIASPFMFITVGLLITYIVIVTILLLNLLIAMMGDTYGHVNEHAEMQWHLERARIIYAIEHELGEEERGERNNKYWTVLGGKRYLQVMVENPKHFRKNEAEEEAEKDKE